MTTRITQLKDQHRKRVVLKLEGTVSVADARLLEEICNDLKEEFGYGITVDLGGVDFLGNESATILCRLKTLPELTLAGMHLFVQQMIESTEAAQRETREKEGES